MIKKPSIQHIELMTMAQQSATHYISVANLYFSHSYPLPDISFRLSGKVAGKALLQQWQIRLNPVLFQENTEAFLTQVIPHEIAHLLTHARFGRVKPHGKEWRSVMQQVFTLPARTTHQFDIRSVQGKTYEYHCQCQTHPLTQRRHNKVIREEARYYCRLCQTELIFTGHQIS